MELGRDWGGAWKGLRGTGKGLGGVQGDWGKWEGIERDWWELGRD